MSLPLASAKSLSRVVMGSRRLLSVSSAILRQPNDEGSSGQSFRAFGLNRVELIGNAGADPKVFKSKTEKGGDYCIFSLYTNVSTRLKDGSFFTQTQLHDVNVPSFLVDYVTNNIHKGTRVFVLGSISYYEKVINEQKVKVAKIQAERVLPIAKSVRQSNDDQ